MYKVHYLLIMHIGKENAAIAFVLTMMYSDIMSICMHAKDIHINY